MKLLIVESPAKAKTIAKYLGSGFNVMSSFGHVRSIPSEKDAVLPDENFRIKYDVIEKSEKHIKEIVSAAKKAKTIYLATDPDREGEAISWHIAELLKSKHAIDPSTSMARVVFNEVTKKAVQNAIANPRELNMDLVRAQQARQALDYLVGFTLSPILWRKLPGSRSAGRVQSVALRLICERENEVHAFKITEYWSIVGKFKQKNDPNHPMFDGILSEYLGKKLDKYDIKTEAEAKDIVSKVLPCKYKVDKIEEKQTKRNPLPPLTTSTMLQEAGNRLGFSAKRTAKVAQKLYEGVNVNGALIGLITYMRTDSVQVSNDALLGARELIENKFGLEFLPEKPQIYKSKTKNAQEAHEAIRPTDLSLVPDEIRSNLTDDEYKLYKIIWQRMVASQMTSAVLKNTAIEIIAHTHNAEKDVQKIAKFRTTGSRIVFPGFYAVWGNDTDAKKDQIPNLQEGDELSMKGPEPIQHFTQPPARYTEPSLVKQMEEIGIGRPSTYATIISILQDRGYVKLHDKKFIPEERGYVVSTFLTRFFDDYVQYNFTANLENDLDKVSSGEKNYLEILHSFWNGFKPKADEVMNIDSKQILNRIEEALSPYLFDEEQKTMPCPECRIGEVHLKNSKYGPFLCCNKYPDCKFAKSLNLFQKDGEIEEKKVFETGAEYPKLLGEQNGSQVFLSKGPYGFYVMRVSGEPEASSERTTKKKGDVSKNKKFVGVQKNTPPEVVTMEYAVKLLELPKVLGQFNDQDILLGIGKYGPYVQHNGRYISVKEENFLDISCEEAIRKIVAAPPKKTFNAKPKAALKKAITKNPSKENAGTNRARTKKTKK